MDIEWIAFLASLILSMTPIIDSYIQKKGEISLLGSIYYSLMWLNYISWLSYSISVQDADKWSLFSGNFWGVIITTYYCYNISYYYINKTYINISYNVYFVCFIIGIIILSFSFYSRICTHEISNMIEDFIGNIASIICITWNMCPNIIVPLIITQGTHITSKYFSLSTVILYNVSSILYCIYGVLIEDYFITYSNLVGGMTNLMCLLALLLSVQQQNNYVNMIKLSSVSTSLSSSHDSYDNTNVNITTSSLGLGLHPQQQQQQQQNEALLAEQEEGRRNGNKRE